MKSLNEILKVLESISEAHETSATPYEVLRLAGFALVYLKIQNRWDDFEQFVTRCPEDLSAEEKAELQKLGIELG